MPFGVLYRALREQRIKQVWEVDVAQLRTGEGIDALIRTSQVAPGRTYLLLASEAGYSAEFGLTLEGPGIVPDWANPLPAGQRDQDEGRHQSFFEHTMRTLARASRLADLYEPFLRAWSRGVFGPDVPPKEVAERLTDGMKVAAAFHDVGKLQRRWQEVAGWQEGQEPVARFPYGKAEEERSDKLPHYAAFAYPFLQELFRQVQGEGAYIRPLEFIALATARHHSLSVTGSITPGDFKPFHHDQALSVLKEIAHASNQGIKDAWTEKAFERIADEGRWKDEPYYSDEAPSPSDDFYLIYCIAQRLVKVADWEDAGQREIELRGEGGADEAAPTTR